MSLKIIFLLIFGAMLLTQCSSSKSDGPHKYQDYKGYALCSCLEYGYKRTGIVLDDPSASVIMNLSGYSMPLQLKQLIDSAAKSSADSILILQPSDYGGKLPIILGCLKFYKSKELKKLIKKQKIKLNYS